MNKGNLVEGLFSKHKFASTFGWLRRIAVTTAFTMAEILLSLTIIGIVAAITLPSLTGNINERTWETQKKALYTRMSQALALMPSLNGYGIGATLDDTVRNAAETFVTDGLAKVFKINNICDYRHLPDCGLPMDIKDMSGQTMALPEKLFYMNDAFTRPENPQHDLSVTNAAAFETQNGESIVVYYNPYCIAKNMENNYNALPNMCANFLYDLNGKKGPNTVGKDIGFITAMYPTDSIVVAPIPHLTNAGGDDVCYTWQDAHTACTQQDPDLRLPNREELIAMSYNRYFIGGPFLYNKYWSSTTVSSDNALAWVIVSEASEQQIHVKENPYYVRCVRR